MRESLNPFVWSGVLARWQKRGLNCGLASCSGRTSLWKRIRRHHSGAFLQGVYYCQPECVSAALTRVLTQLERRTPVPPSASRIPLGLLMVARGQLTYGKVAAALEAQKQAQHGTIGEWLEELGFATEREVVSALGLQWGCPVASSLEIAAIPPFIEIPFPILDTLHMLPLQYVAAGRTLYLACGRRVDHAALYAIDKMIDCRTLPCVGGRRRIAFQLECLRQQPRPHELEFGPVRDVGEMSRIAMSYIARLDAQDIRAGRCGTMIWLRLRLQRSHMNLVFRLRSETQPSVSDLPARSEAPDSSRLRPRLS
ncbi:MAG TPA: hypothetical protein VLT90_05580 [Terriglobales bacterium]|nr:hypothetical protein [Terriglobales bacterium]